MSSNQPNENRQEATTATTESVMNDDAAGLEDRNDSQEINGERVSELEQARREASENYDRYLRVHAEMDNYKKRIERTYADLSRNGKKELLLKLLGVKDNLERALNYGETQDEAGQESVLQGVRLTEYQLDQLLRSEGVVAIDLKGQPFNPEQAEAVTTVVDAALPDHTVSEVVQQGYMYQDEVLRPAKVVVSVREG
jgi:molecular chaperone GrpE